MPKYKALVGLEYNNRRVDAGDVVEDIPAKSIKWLREQGLIEQVDGKGSPILEADEPAVDDKDGE